MIGRVLKDLYEVERKLGEGGPSIVYGGKDRLMELPVAIKMLKNDEHTGLVNPDRFLREARTQARLVHQNIVAIRTIFEEDEQFFIVMEYLDGGDLSEMIYASKTTPCLPLDAVYDLFQQVLLGLGYAHKQGVIHRDIKPANMMITSEGVVKIADFGIARSIADPRLTQTGAVVGSPVYMSPEQCRGQEVGAHSDIYSLGISLFESLCGEAPFPKVKSENQDLFELLRSHIMETPPTFASVGIEVPEAFEAVYQKSLRKNPEERFASCEAFSEALKSSLDQEIALGQGRESLMYAANTEDSLPAASGIYEESECVGELSKDLPEGTSKEAFGLVESGGIPPKEYQIETEKSSLETNPINKEKEQPVGAATALVDLNGPTNEEEAIDLHQMGQKDGQERPKRLGLIASGAFLGLLLLLAFVWIRQPVATPNDARPFLRLRGKRATPRPKRVLKQPRKIAVRARTKVRASIPVRISIPRRRVVPVPRRVVSMGDVLSGLNPVRTPIPRRKLVLQRTKPPTHSTFRSGSSVSLPVTIRWRKKMLFVTGGCFFQGEPWGRSRKAVDYAPQKKVCLDGFWMDQFEVSARQYQQCMRKRACSGFRAKGAMAAHKQTGSEPIQGASWKDARNFCSWAGKRLPTEAEWEMAARGADGRRFPWGKRRPTCAHAQFRPCGSYGIDIGFQYRKKGKSAFGFYDMAGNVSEWVMDCYDAQAYQLLPSLNPLLKRPQCKRHVVRGGSWKSPRRALRTFVRAKARWRSALIGFRCVWGKTKFQTKRVRR